MEENLTRFIRPSTQKLQQEEDLKGETIVPVNLSKRVKKKAYQDHFYRKFTKKGVGILIPPPTLSDTDFFK